MVRDEPGKVGTKWYEYLVSETVNRQYEDFRLMLLLSSHVQS